MQSNRTRVVCLLGMAILAGPLAWAGTIQEGPLTREPWLGYAYEAALDREVSVTEAKGHHEDFLVCDHDGDGDRELVACTRRGLICWSAGRMGPRRRVHWDRSFPIELIRQGTMMRMRASGDVDADGHVEFLVTLRTQREAPWRLLIVDPLAGRDWIREFTLPSDVPGHAEGFWDGVYTAVGLLEGAAPGGGPAIVLTVQVGEGAYPRGLVLFDPERGEEIWRYKTGPNMRPTTYHALDSDGDGRDEILIGGDAPGNLEGRPVGRFADDRATVFLVDRSGRLRWVQRFGTKYYSPWLAVGDVDGDHRPEIVVATRRHNTDPTQDTLAVLAARDGRILAQTALPAPAQGLALVPAERGRPGAIFLGADGAGVFKFRYRQRGEDRADLLIERRIDTGLGVRLIAAGEIVDASGIELVVSVGKTRCILLDEALRPLAGFEDRTGAGHAATHWDVWSAPQAPPMLVVTDGSRRLAWWLPSQPRRYGRAVLFGLVLAGALGLPVTVQLYLGRRRRRAAAAAQATHRERLDLLGRLRESEHGMAAEARELDHLARRVAIAAAGDEEHARFADPLGTSLDFTRRYSLPALREISSLAARAGLEAGLAEQLGVEVVRFEKLVAQVAEGIASREALDAMAGPLRESVKRLYEALAAVRSSLEAHLTTSPARLAATLVREYAEALEGQGLRIEFAGGASGSDSVGAAAPDAVRPVPPDSDERALVHPGHLRFVLDNLIDNARKALASTGGWIRVAVERRDQAFVVIVADSGLGVAEADRERIFEPGFTKTGGTGFGLARSRELLATVGGRLDLATPVGDEGARFVVTLPVYHVRETQEERRERVSRWDGFEPCVR